MNYKVKDYTKPTIYFLKDKEEIVYIGQSVNILSRIGTHINSHKEFDSFDYYHYDGDINKEEKRLIKLHRPKYNGTCNPDYISPFKKVITINITNCKLFLDLDENTKIEFDLLDINKGESNEGYNFDIIYNNEKVGEFNQLIVFPRSVFYFKYNNEYYYLRRKVNFKYIGDYNTKIISSNDISITTNPKKDIWDYRTDEEIREVIEEQEELINKFKGKK